VLYSKPIDEKEIGGVKQKSNITKAIAATTILFSIAVGLFAAQKIVDKHTDTRPLKGAKIIHFANARENAVTKKLSLVKLAGPYATMVVSITHKAHIPARLVAAVIHVENNGFLYHCADRVSGAGAIGPMQLMPDTAWNVERVNPWQPEQNIRGGTLYLKQLIRRFHGSIFNALVAYNAGPTAVANGVAPPSAIAYANTVIQLYGA
jgi:soluble lytic murein transglycosylase-like protein